MPDISMCNGYADGKPCPAMGTCYRHKARPTPNYQSYISKAPYIINSTVGFMCQYYIPMEAFDYAQGKVERARALLDGPAAETPAEHISKRGE